VGGIGGGQSFCPPIKLETISDNMKIGENMAYGKFATYEEVAAKFKIKLTELSFLQEREIIIKEDIFNFIKENLELRRNYVNEYVICESIIFPILSVVSKHNGLPLWSHMKFDVSEEDGLSGIPDYIIAPASDIGTTFEKPVICVSEAKKDNFNEGWAQALAEMIAAQRFNQDEQTEIFGIVTTGNFWQFGKLQQNNLTMEIISYSAIENIQKLFNILNWLFYEAGNNISKIQSIA
jgi:hypothetical protein